MTKAKRILCLILSAVIFVCAALGCSESTTTSDSTTTTTEDVSFTGFDIEGQSYDILLNIEPPTNPKIIHSHIDGTFFVYIDDVLVGSFKNRFKFTETFTVAEGEHKITLILYHNGGVYGFFDVSSNCEICLHYYFDKKNKLRFTSETIPENESTTSNN